MNKENSNLNDISNAQNQGNQFHYNKQLDALYKLTSNYLDADGNCVVLINEEGSFCNAVFDKKNFNVSFVRSRNVRVIIHNCTRFTRFNFVAINSNHSLLYIGPSSRKISNLNIFFKFSKNNYCHIKEGFSCGQTEIMLSENANVDIGEDCMFSDNVKIWNFDGHAILDENGKCINHAKGILIGKHVWLGKDVTISKGAIVSDGSIVGQKSLVTSKFYEPKVILGGIPAKIIRKSITWTRNPPSDFE